MKLSIFYKVFLAFLGLTALVLLATLALARWSFERGFLEYVNTLEEARLSRSASDFETLYVRSGSSWPLISERRFNGILARGLTGSLSRSRTKVAGASEGVGSVPQDSHRPRMPPPPDAGFRPPPPPDAERPLRHESTNAQADKTAVSQARDNTARGPGGPGSPGFAPIPTLLLNAQGNVVAGMKDVLMNANPIRHTLYAEGVKIGELISAPRRMLSSPQETRFSTQQFQTSVIIGLLSLIVAAALAFFMARGLINPLNRAMISVKKLASGSYGARIDSDRRDELGVLMQNIDQLSLVLLQNLTSRRRTLADISHELRTPLTILSGEIEALKDGVRAFNRTQLLSLDQEVQRLVALVNDLYELSLSDVGGLNYTLEPLHLTEILAGMIEGAKMRAEQSGIRIHSECIAAKSVLIKGDSRRLEQLFRNLIENSLAYTDAPGELAVTCDTQEDSMIITFEDSAPGADLDECERLFEPLYRQDGSRNRRTAGAGLGLAICRNIVDAHGGSIVARPSKKGGICTTVRFPVAKA